jgi:hypothetical protein
MAVKSGNLQSDSDACKAIERHSDVLLNLPFNTLIGATARDAVQKDLMAFVPIQDKTERYFSAVALGENAGQHAAYQAELTLQNPIIASEVAAAILENARRVAIKEDRKMLDSCCMSAWRLNKQCDGFEIIF